MNKVSEELDELVYSGKENPIEISFDLTKFFQVINKVREELKRLEFIDNANPSEALKSLERIHTEFSYRTSKAGYECLSDDDLRDINTIKQALLKVQEMKKEYKELKENVKRWHDLLLKSGIDSKGMVAFEIEEYWAIKAGV